jgi:acyl-CoA thioester hydrolase
MTDAVSSTEYVVSRLPFVVRRRVKWGDCDAAGVAYTGTYSDYVLSAAELFYSSLLGGPVYQAIGFATPTRALTFDFRRSLRPDDEFDMRVTVAEIRNRTFVLEIDARTPEGHPVFLATLTPICVAREERRSIEIPGPFRKRLEDYRAACAAL